MACFGLYENSIYDKYNWSGCEKPKISSDDKDHLILLTKKRDAFQQFEVHLGKNYRKGEIIDLHLSYEFEDIENKAIPMLSTTIVEPTNYLKLIVKVPKQFNIDKADAEVFPIIDSRIALDKHVINYNNNGVIEWEILNPKMLLVYSLRWNMPN